MCFGENSLFALSWYFVHIFFLTVLKYWHLHSKFICSFVSFISLVSWGPVYCYFVVFAYSIIKNIVTVSDCLMISFLVTLFCSDLFTACESVYTSIVKFESFSNPVISPAAWNM